MERYAVAYAYHLCAAWVACRSAADGSTRDVTPEPSSGFNVRTRVHEYGGGEHLVAGSRVYFSNFV
jgi:hypothetical protein